MGFVRNEDLGEKKEVSGRLLGWVRKRGYIGPIIEEEEERSVFCDSKCLIPVKEEVKEPFCAEQPLIPFRLSHDEQMNDPLQREDGEKIMKKICQEVSDKIIKKICQEINLCSEDGDFPREPSSPRISSHDVYERTYLEIFCKDKIFAKERDEIRPAREGIEIFCRNEIVERRVQETSQRTEVIENRDFAQEPDWVLVGKTMIVGFSTGDGRILRNNEIVHFNFPFGGCGIAMDAKAALNIVSFRTERSGEIGDLSVEWATCLIPLVNSSKVKVLGRCVNSPVQLRLGQPIVLSASFYIHQSVFTISDKSSQKFGPTRFATATWPLLTLLNLLKLQPCQNAESARDFDSRNRWLTIDDETNEIAPFLPLAKRRKDCPHQIKDEDEHSISESYLNKIVGALDVYNLEEMEPPETLACVLKPYQKQALYWMSQLEIGKGMEGEGKILHPCWAAYYISDEKVREIYVNIFTKEVTTKFPAAMQMPRGGILADAMGLGKTVTTIALILSKRGRGSEDGLKDVKEERALGRVKGGTLIVCPMTLLSQWEKELQTHSEPDSISVLVHYGGGRTENPKVLSQPDVVLTTYGVLSSSYKDMQHSVLHYVEWHRVVLDEAHIIKSPKSKGAKAAFALSSLCRWCLTGTPLQNTLDDLYSLLCFLHVEPWCDWDWWNEQIKKPYKRGDERSLKLVNAILKPLMLRRTKESKDKYGSPILVLPPIDIQVIECELSEAERDFYDALYKRSKVQFEKYVAQGKVLQNYANILELLLRLRQCCNHPFLVMNRSYSQESTDLNKLSRKFLQMNPGSAIQPKSGTQTGPSQAYIKEVVEGLKNGENAECPICYELPDEPVLTPCAHRMCRECLLLSWPNPSLGNELNTIPSGARFKFDIEENWTESTKVSILLEFLELARFSDSGEKTIIFSQWTSFLDLLEISLKDRNFEFLRFDGTLFQKQREIVLNEFAETKDKTILLMSLKAGGVGLNLTAASNVFLMDPWWNPAVEEQAIMRVHRIGQNRPVRIRRFIVKNSVEERMLELQAKKLEMIAGALTDEEFRRDARVEELKMLFR